MINHKYAPNYIVKFVTSPQYENLILNIFRSVGLKRHQPVASDSYISVHSFGLLK
jgi:hypothetical protein